MPVNTDPAAVHEAVTRGIHDVLPTQESLTERLMEGEQLTAYLGIDPTGPDLHVGHLSQLQRLGRLQELGHSVTLLIGDFTGMIGDPTDKSAARVQLTREQVLANAAGYKEQAGRILDFDSTDNPVNLRYNSEWLGPMTFGDVVELAARFTVAQVLERRNFSTRLESGAPVGLHEILYPLMQGWDSVKIVEGGVDIEVGGSDQTYNMLVGRDLVRAVFDKEKYVIAGRLLADPSGKKIGKTEGNMVTLTDPPLDTFGHVMRWGDGITPGALELCTRMPMTEVDSIKEALAHGELSGLDGKKILAQRLVHEIYGAEAAAAAAAGYAQISKRDVRGVDPSILRPAVATTDSGIVAVLVDAGLARTNSEARRLVEQSGVRVDGQTVGLDWKATANRDGTPIILHAGKYVAENLRAVNVVPGRTSS